MKILLGIAGGIAAYKSAELLRELQRHNVDVQVAMSDSAQRFITPLTFAALSGHPVLSTLWNPTGPEATTTMAQSFHIEHVTASEDADAILIAPATANTIAHLAHGFANDILSALCLASTAPLFMAPAMNVNMWNHPATQANVQTLRNRGTHIIAPTSGELACGAIGDGRLADPLHIAATVLNELRSRNDLRHETFLITAGGTREPIDPVRYLTNRSSGKMGHALAEAARARGARVILITTAHTNIPHIAVNTAAEMQHAVLAHLASATTVIMAAAVSDYHVATPSSQKLKKSNTLTLELSRNDDILLRVIAHRNAKTLVIGFAAETENLLEEARRKLREKGLDAIVANDVSQSNSGFESNYNAGYFITSSEEIELPHSTKRDMADQILHHLIRHRSKLSEIPSKLSS